MELVVEVVLRCRLLRHRRLVPLSLARMPRETRFGVFDAGVASTKDPRYVVVPQRERVRRGEAVRA